MVCSIDSCTNLFGRHIVDVVVGIDSDDVSTFYESYIFPNTLKGIERVLSKNGYTMQVSFTDNRLYREEAILRTILEKNTLDGLIVEPAKSALPNPNIRYYRELQERGVPLIFFNSYYQELDAPCVRLDDVGVARKAVSLLIHAGHSRIGGIFKCDDAQGQRRYQGYLEAMLTSGCRPGQDQVLWIDTPEMMDMKVIGDYLFHRMRDCSAVLCYNDQVAFQVVEMATERGIRVPEDLSVVGIDDAYLAHMEKIRIIHGRGTGALKGAVTRVLQKSRYIKSFESAPFNEGGYGATVAYLKGK